MRNSMDYIYTSGEQKIVIEVEQKSVRQSVAEQYVRSRKCRGLPRRNLQRGQAFHGVILQDLKAAITIRLWR